MPDHPGAPDIRDTISRYGQRLRNLERVPAPHPLLLYDEGQVLGYVTELNVRGNVVEAHRTSEGYAELVLDVGAATDFDAIVDHDLDENDVSAGLYVSFADVWANLTPRGSVDQGTVKIYLRTNNRLESETVVIPDGFDSVYIEGRFVPIQHDGTVGYTQMGTLSFSVIAGGRVDMLHIKGVTVQTLNLATGSGVLSNVILSESYVASSLGLGATSSAASISLYNNPRITGMTASDAWSIRDFIGNYFVSGTATFRPADFRDAVITGNTFQIGTGLTWTWQFELNSGGTGRTTFSNNVGIGEGSLTFSGISGSGNLFGEATFIDNTFSGGNLSFNSINAGIIKVLGNQLGGGQLSLGGGLTLTSATVVGNEMARMNLDGYAAVVVGDNRVNSGYIHIVNSSYVSVVGNVLVDAVTSTNNRGAIYVELIPSTISESIASVVGNALWMDGGSSAPSSPSPRFGIEIVGETTADFGGTIQDNAIWWNGTGPHANYIAMHFGNNGGVARLRAEGNVGRAGTIIQDDSGVAVVSNSFGGLTSGGGGTAGTSPPGMVSVEDEGIAAGDVTRFDFVGAGVTATAAGGEATVTIPGETFTDLEVEDEGVSQGPATAMDFVGAGVTASVAAGVATVTIPGGGTPTPGWGGITNAETDRVYDADSTTVTELANTLATLIADLIAQGTLAT